MQIQTSRIGIAPMQPGEMPLKQQSIPPDSFVHRMNVLYVNTRVLAANVLSLHLHVAGQENFSDSVAMLLSRFQLDLADQANALQLQIGMIRGVPAPAREWVCYAELWRIPEIRDVPAGLARVLDATDLLMELHEYLLPTAAGLCDHAVSYYLLAGHLTVLNEHWHCIRSLKVLTGEI